MKSYLFFKTLLGMIFLPIIMKLNKNIIMEGKVRVKSFPYIHLKNNSKLHLGNNVMLNSSNYGYHINMYKGVKIFADGINSEIHIGTNTRIHGSCIHAQSKITIGENCLIAANCNIIDSNGHLTSMDSPENRIDTIDFPQNIIIEDNVWIGASCIILKGVTIGNGSVIAAGSVVKSSIPPNVIAGGNPAKVLKSNSKNVQNEKRLK
ncbi:acyltransferase [Brumimicrobium mesophilum]|uniref:acyltransferase n=1 Tax=Brumimicrobium mesophilum TaxID=392717 RepID=UPI000D13ECB6|nr:acyltransferase [Brumimicrobium mesophilum]